MAEQWYIRQLKVAVSELVGPDGAKYVEKLGVDELEDYLDPDFLEHNRLILQAASKFSIDPNKLMNQSIKDLKSLLGIKENRISNIGVDSWSLIPYHMQPIILAYLPTIDAVAAFCRLLGKKICAKTRIFQRLFSYKYGAQYNRYLKDHPDHINPEWMLRAYEVDSSFTEIVKFKFEHANGKEIFIRTDFKSINFGRNPLKRREKDTQLDALVADPKAEYTMSNTRMEYKEDLTKDFAESLIKDYSYQRYIEKVVYGLLKLGYVQKPDDYKLCIDCNIRNIAGECDQCGQKYCKECFEGVHARKHE